MQIALVACVIFVVFIDPVAAQDFNLFEEVEVSTSSTQSRSRQNRESRATISSPEFTLAGTSRIGSISTAMLENKNGETVVVRKGANENSAVPGFTSYLVVDISAGRVSIQFPDGSPCVEFLEQGVRCNGGANIASLSLVTGDAIQVQSRSEESDTGDDTETDEEDAPPANPFEALRAAQSDDGASGDPVENSRNSRFTPRRIDPSDVPPGMRVVSTPFGDRLVER